jgi:hypothetical protein
LEDQSWERPHIQRIDLNQIAGRPARIVAGFAAGVRAGAPPPMSGDRLPRRLDELPDRPQPGQHPIDGLGRQGEALALEPDP